MVPHPELLKLSVVSSPVSPPSLIHRHFPVSHSLSPLWRQRNLERERILVSLCVSVPPYINRLPQRFSLPFIWSSLASWPLPLCKTSLPPSYVFCSDYSLLVSFIRQLSFLRYFLFDLPNPQFPSNFEFSEFVLSLFLVLGILCSLRNWFDWARKRVKYEPCFLGCWWDFDSLVLNCGGFKFQFL